MEYKGDVAFRDDGKVWHRPTSINLNPPHGRINGDMAILYDISKRIIEDQGFRVSLYQQFEGDLRIWESETEELWNVTRSRKPVYVKNVNVCVATNPILREWMSKSLKIT